MNIKIYPSSLSGTVTIPPSKSITHRALICASLANGESIIYNPLFSDDTIATISCLKSLGVDIFTKDDRIIISGKSNYRIKGRLDAKDSASTIRFLIPIISVFYDEFTIYGSKRLMQRLKTEDLNLIKGLAFTINLDNVIVSGKLDRNLRICEKSTSQFISGLLLSQSLREGKLTIDSLDNPYIKLTLDVMKAFNVEYKNHQTIGMYKNIEYTVESDFSSASFFIAMMLNNKGLKIKGLNFNSIQGDKRFINFLELMGAKFIKDNNLFICVDSNMRGIDLDLSLYPDLVPILAFVAAISKGVMRIKGISKLEFKESNRIIALYKSLKSLGANIEIASNTLIIKGKDRLKGDCIISGENDHRIIMSLAAISSSVSKPFVIEGAQYVDKSFPDFFTCFYKIGGKYESKL